MLEITNSLDAVRQLNICNSCRYCEGYCAVFTGLERRTVFEAGDIKHLANLCHDCRSCLYACPYSPPHEFAINLPKLLAEVRRETYDTCIELPVLSKVRRLRGWTGALSTLAFFVVLDVVLSAATVGVGSLTAAHPIPASPYSVVAYPAILVSMILPFLASCCLLVRGASTYWTATNGSLRDFRNWRAVRQSAHYAASLEYLRGGGEPCHENEKASPSRRVFHQLVSYGFSSCLLSTISAGILQDIVGRQPPYALWSVPVVLGMLGGTGLVVGCTGLIVLKRRSDPLATDLQMAVRDYGLLVALEVLAITGLLTLATRDTSAYGIVFVVHLATVGACFVIAPYTKFVHWIYRSLAIFKDNLEAMDGAVVDTAMEI